MACGTGFCAGKLIAVLVAVGAGGYASYNYATDGCPLGTCGTNEKAVETDAAFQQIAATNEREKLSSSCTAHQAEQLVEVAASEPAACGAASECPMDGNEALTEVAATTDAPACQTAGICPMTGEPIAAKDCPMNGDPADCPHAGSCDGGQCPAATEDEVAANESADNTDG